MRISVVVPLYNAEPYVGAALDSILGQTLPPDEVIVVDDGSTDRGGEVVAGYGEAVRLLRQENLGSATALNRGIRTARGARLAFLDADDLWLPEKLELQSAALDAEPALDGVFAHVEVFLSGDAAATGRAVPPQPLAGVNRPSLLAQRGVFERFGLFDETLRTADFVPWWARAAALGFRHRVLAPVLVRRRIHGTNTGIVRRDQQQQESLAGLRDALAIRRRMKPPPG